MIVPADSLIKIAKDVASDRLASQVSGRYALTKRVRARFWNASVKPINAEVARGLIGTADDFEITGTSRQGRPEYRTLRDFWFEGYRVKAGFVFDVHSLPAMLRHRQPKNPAWWGPPLMHDYLLETGLVSIEEANRIYLRAMGAIGVRLHERFLAFQGVELARHLFPDRITQVDADNWDYVEAIEGHRPVQDREGSARRKASLGFIRKFAPEDVLARLEASRS